MALTGDMWNSPNNLWNTKRSGVYPVEKRGDIFTEDPSGGNTLGEAMAKTILQHTKNQHPSVLERLGFN